MASLQDYKCPACGGALEFDSSIQKLKCPFCDSTYEMSEFEKKDEELNQQEEGKAEDAPEIEEGMDSDWDITAGTDWNDGETDGLKSYICKSCGGEIVGSDTLAASSCPYCGNPVVVMDQFKGMLKPDVVIPFKLDKKAAKAGLMKHLSNKKLLPKVFKDQNHIDEIKGIYVPYWIFDADVDADIQYDATKVAVWSDKDYEYTKTSVYKVIRGGNVAFDHVPVDGSSQMPDDLMESIEPFDYSQAVDFQTAYLAGYFADKYDVTAEQCVTRANERVKASTQEEFAKTVMGYTTVMPKSSRVNIKNGKAKYGLYPVWILNTTWNGEKYLFAMNGQTGKFVGNLPVDKGAATKWQLIITAGVAVAAFAIQYLLWLL